MQNKQRKTSMRQTVDEHSPTYSRAIAAIKTAQQAAGQYVSAEKPVFVRGARVKSKPAKE